MLRVSRVALLVAVSILVASGQSALANYPGGNGRIFFGHGGGTTWAMNPDGSDASQVSDQSIVGPWSPDGTMMVHEKYAGFPTDFTVWSVDGPKVADLSVPDEGHNPSWTPDGRIIYNARRITCFPPYYYCDEQALGIWVVNLDGTQNTKVMDDAINPALSPDGTKIAFLGGSPAGGTTLYVANGDGSGRLPLTSGLFEDGPEWSPDGRRIGFVRELCTSRCTYDLWSVAVDGTDERQLTFTDDQERGLSWSPDGSKIAVTSSNPDLSGSAGIFTVNATDGSGLTQLRSDGGYPFWRPFINRRPDCSNVSASPSSLWPPNRKLVTVTLAGATDPDGDAVSLVVTGVTSDPEAGPSDARVGPAQNQARVRAVRGRTYEIAFDVGDDAGAHCFGTVSVAVTHP